jgi:REP element-mobilizing transposase RayT
MNRTEKSNQSARRVYRGKHRFEHWYRNNQVYFITARCHGKHPAFASERAKGIFWERFEQYAEKYRFRPWITSLMDNHYHTLGYLGQGSALVPMMKGIHGSIAKLVNDELEARGGARGFKSPCLGGRLIPFWGDGRKTYFDGCIRDETQAKRAYRYVMRQSERHGICGDWREYPHTIIKVEMDRAIQRATELDAFLRGVRYRRYEHTGRGDQSPLPERPD